MLNDVLTRMEATMDKSPDAKRVYLHVGHDSTIIPFLKTLGVENVAGHLRFGAAVVMELYGTPSNETVVKVKQFKIQYKLCNNRLLIFTIE